MRFTMPQTVVRAPPAVWGTVLAYAAFASLWVGLWNFAVASLSLEPRTRAVLEALRTPAFILVTATCLFVLAMQEVARRHDMERQGRAGEEALARVMARVHDGLVAFDLDGRYTHVNRSAARMLGREHPEDLIGRTIWTEFPGIGGEFRDVFEETLKTGCPAIVVSHYEPWDRWFENRLYPSADGLSMYFTDITERRRADEAVRRSELRHRLAGSRGHVWEWDIEQERVTYPAPFWEHLGVEPPAERDSESVLLRLIHPEDVVRRRDALNRHLADRVPFDLELRARHANGEWRWFHTQGQAVWNDAGRATYMAGTSFDITARVRAEEDLRASEAYRRRLFDQLGDGVLLLDEDLRILDANHQAQAMFGYDFDTLRQRTVHELVDEAEHPRLSVVRSKVLAGARSLDEWLHVRADGSRFPAEVCASTIDDNRTLAVVRDISRRRQHEHTLLAYQLELSELTRKLLEQEQVTSRRLAQALHDRLGQTLAVARLHVDAGIGLLDERAHPGSIEQLRKIDLLLGQSVSEVRQVLTDLRPPLLEAQGLAAALDNEIGERGFAAGSADLVLEKSDDLLFHRWPADIEYAAFMVAREALTNAQKHAGASLVRVILEGHDDALDLEIVDDGRGLDANAMSGRPGHLGMVGMRERAIAIGARFTVDAVTGGGTRVGLRWRARET
jgi:PAS domain S-box-containing protein